MSICPFRVQAERIGVILACSTVEANMGVPQCIASASEEVSEGKHSDDSFGLSHAYW